MKTYIIFLFLVVCIPLTIISFVTKNPIWLYMASIFLAIDSFLLIKYSINNIIRKKIENKFKIKTIGLCRYKHVCPNCKKQKTFAATKITDYGLYAICEECGHEIYIADEY